MSEFFNRMEPLYQKTGRCFKENRKKQHKLGQCISNKDCLLWNREESKNMRIDFMISFLSVDFIFSFLLYCSWKMGSTKNFHWLTGSENGFCHSRVASTNGADEPTENHWIMSEGRITFSHWFLLLICLIETVTSLCGGKTNFCGWIA